MPEIASVRTIAVLSWLAVALISPAQQTKRELPDGPGKATVLKVCAGCHGPLRILGQGHTYDEWGEVVGKMVEEGAKGTDDEFNTVVDYLAVNFPKKPAVGKINVNKAEAGQLQGALDIPAKLAAEIVSYRAKNGAFHSIADLEKVPGLDPEKVEAKKDILEFQ